MSKTPLNIRLKNARKKANLTQKYVYEKLGIAQSTYSSWEVGKSEPDADTIAVLCGIFGITPNDFMEWESKLIDFKCTLPEQTHIKKYRALDERGRQTIDVLLDAEYSRITPAKAETDKAEKETSAVTSDIDKEADAFAAEAREYFLKEKKQELKVSSVKKSGAV